VTIVKRELVCICFLPLAACAYGKPPTLSEPNATPTLFFLPPVWTQTPTLIPTTNETLLSTASLLNPTNTVDRQSDIKDWTAQAITLMGQGLYTRAIQLWDQILLQDPLNFNAYYQRATCYHQLSLEQRILERYTDYINQALKDIDMAISIRGDIGDYYSLRQSIYIGIASIVDREVDREYLVTIALENAKKAYALGTTIEPYPDRIIIIDLIFTMQCKEALVELQPLLDKTSAEDFSRGGLLHIQSQAFACLGKLDQAISAVDASMFNRENMEFKKWLKSAYLYQIGRYAESLSLLDELIDTTPGGGGERYYLRAAIYFAQAKYDLAVQNLETGKENTWMRYEMLPYVEGQIALHQGDKETAISLLLYAETTFEPFLSPTRWKVQYQLANLGVKPLNPTPSVPYPATPIP
jgi:tetratricopeptide (TPR) repeat protein